MKAFSAFFLIFLAGCLGPKVDSCIYDMNQLDAAIRNAPLEATREELVQIVHETKVNYCVPYDSSAAPFWKVAKTGDHTYDSIDWGILMDWINQHTK